MRLEWLRTLDSAQAGGTEAASIHKAIFIDVTVRGLSPMVYKFASPHLLRALKGKLVKASSLLFLKIGATLAPHGGG